MVANAAIAAVQTFRAFTRAICERQAQPPQHKHGENRA
ncbi:cytochrome c biogenesis protein CcdA [Acetobacter orientalis]|uniref:Cytochrome c biogenesis protein CcdA n=1 Tax=Acetobacter orientalis TaxID=146474 RepID=A0A2Z5ZED2_9PROT|nr:cytochrome c biogenesis protein CcdA [Acetobacter orientalis]